MRSGAPWSGKHEPVASVHPPGAALVGVVLLLLALGTLTTGLILISGQERLIARNAEEVLRIRIAAESGVRAVLSRWSTNEVREMATGEIHQFDTAMNSPAGILVATTIERLVGRQYLIRAEAIAENSGARARAGAIVEVLDDLDFWSEYPAALTTYGPVDVSSDTRVEGFDPRAVPADECLEHPIRIMEDLFGAAKRPALQVIDGEEVPTLRLGRLERDHIAAMADRTAGRTVVPRAHASATRCDFTAENNWGTPLQPLAPCGSYFPLIHAPGDLDVIGGEGQGILVVTGDLTLTDGAYFSGVVLVGGRLHMKENAHIDGAVLVLESERPSIIEGGASLAYGPCEIKNALTRSPVVDRPFFPTHHGWVPEF